MVQDRTCKFKYAIIKLLDKYIAPCKVKRTELLSISVIPLCKRMQRMILYQLFLQVQTHAENDYKSFLVYFSYSSRCKHMQRMIVYFSYSSVQTHAENDCVFQLLHRVNACTELLCISVIPLSKRRHRLSVYSISLSVIVRCKHMVALFQLLLICMKCYWTEPEVS